MITENQDEVIGFLSTPAAFGLPTHAEVERIETHASVIFLAGDRARKLKRAVRYTYLDYSTAAHRKAMCEAEVRVNRWTAPALYHGVVAVTREGSGQLALGGRGEPVDWVIEMARFDQSGLFDRLAESGRLTVDLARDVAGQTARFHRVAEPRRDRGGQAGMAAVIDGNEASLTRDAAGVLDPAACTSWVADARAMLAKEAGRLDARRAQGFVRGCHGDLHLRNIVLHGGEPVLFDAIEFNDVLSCIDVLYDLAFLLMDLWHRDLPAHANGAWNRYLADTRDLRALSVMPLFLSCRAAVRAVTTGTAAALQKEPGQRGDLTDLARGYLRMARDLLNPAPPAIVAIGGWSGSGKSTVAAAIAPSLGAVPGAVVLRSDEIRKRMFGVSTQTRLGSDAYTEEISRDVYADLCEDAVAIVRGGHAVVVDAVFASPAERAAIEKAALDAGVAFHGLWLDASAATLVARVEARREDPSDATADVVRSQVARDPGPLTWTRIDASVAADAVAREAARVVAAR